MTGTIQVWGGAIPAPRLCTVNVNGHIVGAPDLPHREEIEACIRHGATAGRNEEDGTCWEYVPPRGVPLC